MRLYAFGILCILLFTTLISKAQDIRFSQFYANKLYLNPALAGSDHYSHMSLNYRNQWPNLDFPFVSYSISYDRFMESLNGGIGFMVIQDDQGNGALKTTTVSGIYSYYLRLSEELIIRSALKVAFMQRKLEWDKLLFPDQISPIYGSVFPHNSMGDPANRSKNGIDFSSGLVGSYRNYYLGFSIHHLSQPNLNFSEEFGEELEMRYTAHFGVEYSLSGSNEEGLRISPNLLFQKQGDFSQMNYGLYLQKSILTTGVWFSQNFNLDYDSIIVMLGLNSQKFRLAYSFDYAISKLVHTNTGAHEISLSYLIGEQVKHRIKPVRCPKF